jgi:hypothetical protein
VEIEVSLWSYEQQTKDVIATAKELGIAVVAYSYVHSWPIGITPLPLTHALADLSVEVSSQAKSTQTPQNRSKVNHNPSPQKITIG